MKRTTLTLDGRTFTIRPPTIAMLKRIARFDDETRGMTPLEKAEATSDLLFTAIRRAHPELTREELDNLLDGETIQEAIDALLIAGGLVKVAKAGGAQGEAESP